MKILLVEDNELNRDMLTRRLKRKGFAVLCAENGQEGIDFAKSKTPEIILLDLSLPVVDGWTAAERLKADELSLQHLRREGWLRKARQWGWQRSSDCPDSDIIGRKDDRRVVGYSLAFEQ